MKNHLLRNLYQNMDNKFKYDKSNPKSIEEYGKLLTNKSLRNFLGNGVTQTYKGKGKLGQILEDAFWGYKPNSISEPDFKDAGVEIKSLPIKKTKKGYSSKERLVFNSIDYNTEHQKTFATSSFWLKNQLLLLMFYLYEKEKQDLDYIFKIIRLWQFPDTDLKIIKDDWELIVSKIREGLAHELSEGDTLYLGACTKGANRNSLTTQPNSSVKAMRRAFSLKSKYLNFIIEKSLAGEEIIINYEEYDKILNEGLAANEPRITYRKLDISQSEPAVKSRAEYHPGETFEQLVIRKIQPYYGLTADELEQKLNLKHSISKNKFSLIATAIVRAILGVSKPKIEEFEKADIEMKTIRLEQNGTLRESMSFAQIKYQEIVKETWEDSYWYNTITKRFFFVIFQKDENEDLRLKKVMFWTMPAEDIQIAESFWEDTKTKIQDDDYNHFVKISDNRICHIRPKGINSRDLMKTPSGRLEKKKSYWLNSSYIKQIISE